METPKVGADSRTLMWVCRLAALGGFVCECYRDGEMVKKADEMIEMFKKVEVGMSNEDHENVRAFIRHMIVACLPKPDADELLDRLTERDDS